MTLTKMVRTYCSKIKLNFKVKILLIGLLPILLISIILCMVSINNTRSISRNKTTQQLEIAATVTVNILKSGDIQENFEKIGDLASQVDVLAQNSDKLKEEIRFFKI